MKKIYSKVLTQSNLLFLCREEYEELVVGSCEQLIIELTEKCNLRCKYCIYNEHHPSFRGFGYKNISIDVVKKAIDYVLSKTNRNRFALTFYGGEPLINFDVMKKSIDYAIEKYPHISFDIGFTTNLTLLNKEMITYFNTLDNIHILCSIDGPKEYHDKYRINVNGDGTHYKTIEGLKLLLDNFYEYGNPNKGISINCVISPPYNREKFEEIYRYFYEDLKIPADVDCRYSYTDIGEMKDFENCPTDSSNSTGILEVSPMEAWATDSFISNENKDKYFKHISQDILRVAKRMRTDKDIIDKVYLHGNCIPGQRRLYITVDGDFKTCERVGNIYNLGNVYEGYNFDNIYKKYYLEYIDYFRKICKNCWGRSMCPICYEQTMDKDGVNKDVELKVCPGSRMIMKDALINYYRALESDPFLLQEYIDKYNTILEENESYRRYEV